MCNAMKLVPLTNASVDRIQASTDTSVLKMYGLTRSTIMCCYQQIDRVTENKKTLTRKFDDRYKYARTVKNNNEYSKLYLNIIVIFNILWKL